MADARRAESRHALRRNALANRRGPRWSAILLFLATQAFVLGFEETCMFRSNSRYSRFSPHLRYARLLCMGAASLLTIGAAFQPVRAQAVYGSIIGTVTDTSGAAVPNATVTVTDVAKGTSTTAQTNGSGEYSVQHLIPDTYRVEVSATGFSNGMVDKV